MNSAKKDILALLIVIELLSVFYCIDAILMISHENTLARRTDAITESISLSMFDPEPAVVDGVKAYEEYQAYLEELNRWKGPVLSKGRGVNYGPSGKETYYNLNMTGVVNIMRSLGYTGEYWVRDDGCKMLGDYIIVAANFNIRPRGTIVETSLGDGIVCDTGGFAKKNPTQIDIAVTW